MHIKENPLSDVKHCSVDKYLYDFFFLGTLLIIKKCNLKSVSSEY